jgi:nucleoside-diphosphate-sugar epimerase
MNRQVALVTGAGGEVGHLLIPTLKAKGFDVVALDLVTLPAEVREHCVETVEASVLDREVLQGLFRRWSPSHVFHLAAVLSSKAEREPDLAHRVNVQGTYGLFRLCHQETSRGDGPVRFVFPSTIAVYGIPDAETKDRHGAVREFEWTTPGGVYGCNKLYCELLGSYLSAHPPGGGAPRLDFRAVRYPGLISADTLPTGGTTDYAPEMLHAAAQQKPYTCFVSEDSRLPFMTMPDAVEALLQLAEAEPSRLTTRIYNVQGFSATAGEIRAEVLQHFPDAEIDFGSVPERQTLIDTWPGTVDDTLARRDWRFLPRHGLAEALADYLIPALRTRYAKIVRRDAVS